MYTKLPNIKYHENEFRSFYVASWLQKEHLQYVFCKVLKAVKNNSCSMPAK